MFALAPRTRRTTALLPRLGMPLGWMPEEFATLFNRFFAGLPVMETPEELVPWGLTTEEKEKEIIVQAELPGFEPKEVTVELAGERLTVEAKHEEKTEKGEEKAERTAHVKRLITLPPEIEPEKIEAVYRNGVLEVHVPRKPEAVPRRIEVKV